MKTTNRLINIVLGIVAAMLLALCVSSVVSAM